MSRLSLARHTVWLGAAGTGTSFGILRSLREQFGASVTVVAADIFPAHLIAASQAADIFEQVPLGTDPAFVPELLSQLARHRVDTYVPILDDEILLAAKLAQQGLLDGIQLIAPSVRAAQICFDKEQTARWLVEHGLPTPQTELLRSMPWHSEGVIVKPRCGRGSIGVHTVEHEAELDAMRLHAGDDMLAQTRCRTPEVTIDAFQSRNGYGFRAVCRERLEVKAGVCTKARVFEDAELTVMSRRVAEGLGLFGTFCMQVMRGWDDHGWVITDINPRPGAGTRLTVAAGVDLLAAGFADAWGADPRCFIPTLTAEHFVVRQYAEYVLYP